MQHLYQNDEGETVAADTSEQAAAYWKRTCGDDPLGLWDCEWDQVDDADVTFRDDNDQPVTRRAGDMAAEHNEPVQVLTTY